MTEVREALHRWAVYSLVIANLVAAAMRHSRRARHRRRMWRQVEARWW